MGRNGMTQMVQLARLNEETAEDGVCHVPQEAIQGQESPSIIPFDHFQTRHILVPGICLKLLSQTAVCIPNYPIRILQSRS